MQCLLCAQDPRHNVPPCLGGVLLLEVTNAPQWSIVNGTITVFFQMKRSCLKFIWRCGKGVLLNTGHEMSFSLWRYSKLYEVYFLIYFWVIFDNQLNYLIKALSDRQNLHQLPLQDVFTFRIQKSIPIVFTMVCKIRALINKSQVAVTL